MERTSSIPELQEIINSAQNKGRKIALVPTMGYLHRGHRALAEQAKQTGAFVVMSIFVNPLQFGPNEDYAKYPRDLEQDAHFAEEAGVDVLFHPTTQEMYPSPPVTFVEVSHLDEVLCGAKRPGHFRGVATVVSKLFHIVRPDLAYFGQKDYQQYLIIRRMVSDLNLPVHVCLVPIVREEDGLALSSRNIFLTPEQRREALVLSQSLKAAERRILAGVHSVQEIERYVRDEITGKTNGVIDYAEVRDAADLAEVSVIKDTVVIALAVRFGSTRLIDNILVEVGDFV